MKIAAHSKQTGHGGPTKKNGDINKDHVKQPEKLDNLETHYAVHSDKVGNAISNMEMDMDPNEEQDAIKRAIKTAREQIKEKLKTREITDKHNKAAEKIKANGKDRNSLVLKDEAAQDEKVEKASSDSSTEETSDATSDAASDGTTKEAGALFSKPAGIPPLKTQENSLFSVISRQLGKLTSGIHLPEMQMPKPLFSPNIPGMPVETSAVKPMIPML